MGFPWVGTGNNILSGHVPQSGSPDRGQSLGVVTGYSLLTLEVSGQFGAVPKAAQGVHAVQHVRVQLRQGHDPPHTHPSGRGLLRGGLIPTTPKEHRGGRES